MRALRIQLAIAAATIMLTVPLHTRAQTSAQNLSLEEIVSRMEAARIQSKQTGPFLLQREYRLYHGDEPQPMSQVKAEINVVPPHERDYRITEAKGNGRGEKVVRKILDHEADAEKITPPPTALVRQNYDFQLAGNDMFQGTRCYVVLLKPKRQDPALVNGRAWIDSNTFLVRKIEGQLSKSPSWWVRAVNVSVLFGQVGGMWMQTATNAVADVRVLGRYTVAGRATGVQVSFTEASNRALQKRVRREGRSSVPAELASGVLIRR